MRVGVTVLVVTVAALVSASGALTTDLSKSASIHLEPSSVAAHDRINTQQHLRKHDSKIGRYTDGEERNLPVWLTDNIAGFVAWLTKLDEMDAKAAHMIKGKTVEESEAIFHKLTDEVLDLLKGMEIKEKITPATLKTHPKFKQLSKNEAEYLQEYFNKYWDIFPRLKT
ncbi:hypothetical protein F441_07165, partial [Phytophthora nicotianae CJ01A1]